MTSIDKIIRQMETQTNGVRFEDAVKVCRKYFGPPRASSGSHIVFKMPWQGDPRINIQNRGGLVKPYQVRQILLALERLKTL
jgi:hypothetical protein